MRKELTRYIDDLGKVGQKWVRRKREGDADPESNPFVNLVVLHSWKTLFSAPTVEPCGSVCVCVLGEYSSLICFLLLREPVVQVGAQS